MTDCPNVEMRDSLPELVNGRLSEIAARTVRAHVETCAACRTEVVIIETTRVVLIATTPRIDTARIAGIISAAPARRAPRRWPEWRIAAGIAVIALGAGGLYARNRSAVEPAVRDTVALAVHADSPVTAAATPSSNVPGAAELSVAGSTDGLTDDQLRALLDRLGQVEALPSAEVRRPTIPVGGLMPDDAGMSDSRGTM